MQHFQINFTKYLQKKLIYKSNTIIIVNRIIEHRTQMGGLNERSEESSSKEK